MERLNFKTREEAGGEIQSPERAETREEKMGQAEKSVRERFELKIVQALDNVAENPYFRDIAERSF